MAFSAFDFRIFREQASVRSDIPHNGVPLRLHTEAGDTLFSKDTRKYEIKEAMFNAGKGRFKGVKRRVRKVKS